MIIVGLALLSSAIGFNEEVIQEGRVLRLLISFPDSELNAVAVHSDPALPVPLHRHFLAKAFNTRASTPSTLTAVMGDFNTVFPGDHRLDLSTNVPDYNIDDGVGSWLAASFGDFAALACDGYSRCGFQNRTLRSLAAIDHILVDLPQWISSTSSLSPMPSVDPLTAGSSPTTCQ